MSDNARGMKRAATAHALRHSPIFSGIASSELAVVAELVKPRSLARGAYLFREGDPAHGFFIVQSGAVSVHRVGAGGKEQVIHIFRPGDSFAEAVVADEAGYPADCRALESSTVLEVPRSALLDLIARRPELALRILATMAGHLRVLVSRIEDLTLKDVETRFAAWLTRCLRESGDGSSIELRGTKRVLAAELGTTSETLSRTFARLTDAGIITVKGRVISVLDGRGLRALLSTN